MIMMMIMKMTCRPDNLEPLPTDLQDWVDGAGDHGVIFVSFGSVIKV